MAASTKSFFESHPMPEWAAKAQQNSNKRTMYMERKEALLKDSEMHEVDFEESEDERHLSSLFVDHDPSQCIDKSEFYRNFMNFVEDRQRPKHTILEDLPEDIYDPTEKRSPKRKYENTMASLSLQTLRFLAGSGDKEALRILNFRAGQLARSVDAEMIIEEGERAPNGKLIIHTRTVNGKTAEDIREIFA